MARSYGGNFVLQIRFYISLTNYVNLLKEDYYVWKKICKDLIMSGCST